MITSFLLVGAIIWAIVNHMEDPVARIRGENDKQNPQEHLAFVVNYMRAHGLTLPQLGEAWEGIPFAPVRDIKEKRGDVVVKVMYFLGTLFVFAGLGVYISMFWDTMSSGMRIFSTLGVGMALSVLSVVMMKEGRFAPFVMPLILLAATIQCGGWFVFLHEMFPHGDDVRKAALFCCGMMAFQQGMVFHTFRNNALAFTAVAFLYGALQAALDLAGMKDEHIALLLGGSMIFTAHVMQRTAQRSLSGIFYLLGAAWFNTGVFTLIEGDYTIRMASMVTGISLFSFALAMRHASQHKLAGFMFFIGSGLFYAGLFDEVAHTPMELLYLAFAVGMMYVSAMMQSRALLATSVLAILGFIGYYTNEHFLNSTGWPIALMLMGLAFLGIGTMAVRIKRRYNM